MELPDGSARWVFTEPFANYGRRDFVALTDARANKVVLYPGMLLYAESVGECIYAGDCGDGRMYVQQMGTELKMYVPECELVLVLHSVDSMING